MSRLRIPTIEETIQANAYEARMHFLINDGSAFGRYLTLPGMTSEPTPEAAQAELPPPNQHPGQLMWVSFEGKPEYTDPLDKTEPRKHHRAQGKLGEVAITVYPGELRSYREVIASPERNSFVKLWLGRFAMDRTRDNLGLHRHPLWDVHSIYQHFDIRGGLAEVGLRAKREQWNPRINLKLWYVASLARETKKDHPELFKGDNSWQQRMGVPLRHKSLPPLRSTEVNLGNLRPFRYVSEDATRVQIKLENPSEKDALLFSTKVNLGDKVRWKFDGIQSIDHSDEDPLSVSYYADADSDTETLTKELGSELESIRTARALKEQQLRGY